MLLTRAVTPLPRSAPCRVAVWWVTKRTYSSTADRKVTENDDPNLKRVINLVDAGIKGFAMENHGELLTSSKALALAYAQDPSMTGKTGAQVDSMVRNEAAKAFACGFGTGIGGVITLPIGIPAALGCSWLLQSRLAGAIAELNGHDTDQEAVKILVMAAMIGRTSPGEIFKLAPEDAALKVCRENMIRAPFTVMLSLQHQAAKQMVRRGFERSAVRGVPLIGGVVGGVVDAGLLMNTGSNATKLFSNIQPMTDAPSDQATA